MIRFFNPAMGYRQHPEINEAIQRVLNAGDLILRQDVEDFEAGLAKFLGKKYAVGMNSGTDALYLSLWALGIGKGDEVITSSHTFVASVQVIVQLGATPVLVDLGDDWKEKITPKTKAVIPCHIAGVATPWEPVEGIHMVEDACQSIGAAGVGKGVTQCYSFYPAKILGAYGDAGGVTTDDEGLYNELKELRGHYKKDYSKWGINSRLDNLQAAVLNEKLKFLPRTLERRKEIADMYLQGLSGVGLPENTEGRVWQDFIIVTNQRDGLYNFLKTRGIETMKNEYPFPIPKLPKSLEFEKYSLRLPINEVLHDHEVEEVISTINEYFG